MALSRATIAIVLFLSIGAYAQENRYMVFFKDKNGSPFSTELPGEYLSEKAIERRIKQGIPVTDQDFPVNPSYIQDVKVLGIDVMFTTRWMNGILVECLPADIAAAEQLTFVERTEMVAPGNKPVSSGRRKFTSRRTGTHSTQPTDKQLSMIGLTDMQGAGFHGEGMVIAILDAGFEGVNVTDPFQHIFSEGRLNTDASYDFVFDQPDVYRHDDHGTAVFSVMAGYLADAYTGGAYKANYQLYVTEDVGSEYRIEEYNWLFAAERADSAGVDIINSSLGYNLFDNASMNYSTSDLDGKTAVVSQAAQLAAERGIIVVASAGNEGNNSWGLITPPSDNEFVLAAAAVNESGVRAPISSKGPSADGRIKPDVAALGVGVSVIRPSGSIGTSSGTSFASPLIASLVAGVWQKYPDMKNTEIMEAIRSSASQADNPDNLLGYGIPNFKAVVNKIEWMPQENIVDVFPNPVIDTLRIRPQNPVEVSDCRVEIVTIQGQVIDDQQIVFNWVDRNYLADFTGLSSGMYFVRVWINDRIFCYKIVKM